MTDAPDGPTEYDVLLSNLEELETAVDSPEDQELVEESRRIVQQLPGSGVFGKVVKGFGRRDLGEAFIGSLVFGIPLLVEDGTLEIGEFIAGHIALSLGTVLFAIMLAIGILYFVELQKVKIVNPFFGVIPRRLVGVVGVAYITGLVLMTASGRVDWLADPWIAVNQVNVVFVPMAMGASLGDILPGT